MSYDLRPVTTDGEACSTCRYAEFRLDEHSMPWYLCAKLEVEVRTPDELVCDDWNEMP